MSRYEEPEYVVVADRDGYEIRRYESYLVAETTVRGGFESTGNVAFQRLAGFIFGRNSQSEKMNMTVPVTHQPAADGSHRYRFVMERAYSEDSLPLPVDDTVDIVRVPAGHYAALRYRGGRGEGRFNRAAEQLLSALERDGVEVSGPREAAAYDGPFVPAPIRRNEVLVPVLWPEGNAP
jgi:hypothetical protein